MAEFDNTKSSKGKNIPQRALQNNGDSLSLSNDEITDVYFGLNMGEAQKAKIVELVSKGPFNPTFWNSYQDGSDFQLKFEQY